jgi:hypothetical protein
VTLAALATSCSGAVADPTDEHSPEEVSTEVARVRQAIGETTCGTTAADTSIDASQIVQSPNTTYDHATCRDAFIVDVKGAKANASVQAGGYVAPVTDAFSALLCLFTWGYSSVWRVQGSSATKVFESFDFGTPIGTGRFGGSACAAVGTFTIPSDGDYKLVASSAVLFGAKQPAYVGYASP